MSASSPTRSAEAISNSKTTQPTKIGTSSGLNAMLLAIFTTTIFASATLLFVVQPMVGKILLPMLGGAPAVWNTCMVFFQATLLAGYLAAHLLTRYVPLRFQIVIFPVALAVAMLTLPMTVGQEWVDQLLAGSSPTWWLFLVLLCNVAPVFFLMSMTSPLLQKWFAKSGHPQANDPYFLYAASNVGSILALLSYPFFIEVQLGVTEQAHAWTTGFGIFSLLAIGCGVASWLGNRSETPTIASLVQPLAAAATHPLTWRRRAWWTVLAFIPSSLMLGVTTYLSTDVASIPLIWIVPLTLYLLTFVLAFASRQWISSYWAGRIAGLLILTITVTFVTKATEPQFLIVPMHLIMFFLVALLCHQRLAADRPSADSLTDFYLWLSVGGVLGGIFNALVAPSLFVTIVEYPLVIIFASFFRETRSVAKNQTEGQAATQQWAWASVLFAAGIFLTIVGLTWFFDHLPSNLAAAFDRMGHVTSLRVKTAIIFGIPAAFVFHQLENRIRFSMGLVAILLVSTWNQSTDADVLERSRNFYGTVHSERSELESGEVVRMFHGHIVHGWQWADADRQHLPLTYYGPSGGVHQAISHKAAAQDSINIGAIGLGTGSLAALLRPTDSMTFYEINPQVLAHAERHFTYLQDARDRQAELNVQLGDARLVLESETRKGSANQFDVLAVDAFSSDSIPAHLVTTECMQTYMSHLKSDGILAFHITNRYVDLEPVVAALAEANGLVGYSYHFHPGTEREFDESTGEMACSWILLSRDAANLQLEDAPLLRPLRTKSDQRLWTDDYTNVISALRF